jgi:tRNA (guanine37-N1)-methyltransferase
LRVTIITLFPELFDAFIATSIVGRAIDDGALKVICVQLRERGIGRHRSVDDTPYGGGSGMVLRVEPIVDTLEDIDARAAEEDLPPAHRVLLTPQGRRFNQSLAQSLVPRAHVALICGRYEGFDERVRHFVHEEVSLGDFVMTGGEVAAMAVIEATARLLPGVLGNAASSYAESHSEALSGGLEYAQYTRPPEFRGHAVPDVLLSGNHARIDAYRKTDVEARTEARRPDLAASRKREPENDK